MLVDKTREFCKTEDGYDPFLGLITPDIRLQIFEKIDDMMAKDQGYLAGRTMIVVGMDPCGEALAAMYAQLNDTSFKVFRKIGRSWMLIGHDDKRDHETIRRPLDAPIHCKLFRGSITEGDETIAAVNRLNKMKIKVQSVYTYLLLSENEDGTMEKIKKHTGVDIWPCVKLSELEPDEEE